MKQSELALKLKEWAKEFSDFSEPLSVPEKFWAFLANRLVDIGTADEDPDVIRVRIFDSLVRVRIVGFNAHGLEFNHADGSAGFGMCRMKDVHPSDKGKLSKILERLDAARHA